MKKIFIIISGPTASGKSFLADYIHYQLKKSIIINADSMQIYKELKLLSSQPENITNKRYSLYSVLNYYENFSVKKWLDEVEKIIKQKYKTFIIVGGTGLYISKLIDGISLIDDIEGKIKTKAYNIVEQNNKEYIIKYLQKLGDNDQKIYSIDKKRLARRLEIILQTKKNIKYWYEKPKYKILPKDSFTFHINLNIERDKLYENCDNRLLKILKKGAIEEVKSLNSIYSSKENHIDHAIFNTLGYREITSYLANKINKDEMIYQIAKKTKNYAKRQLTWFRNQFQEKFDIEVLDKKNLDLISQKINEF